MITLCLPIEQGGLNLLDLKSLIQSAHLSWIKRLCLWDYQKWTLIPRLIFGAQSTFFRFFLEKKKERLKTTLNPFYREILKTWLDVYYRLPKTEEERHNESLWNNDFITCGGKALNWKKCEIAGIVQIQDLIKDSNFMGRDEIQEEYGVNLNFLEWLQLKNVIPWVKSMSMMHVNSPSQCLYVIVIEDQPQDLFSMPSKTMYKVMLAKHFRFPTAQSKWSELYEELKSGTELWCKLYLATFAATRETKLQSLQYKIHQRIVPCRLFLFQRKGIDSPDCLFCGGKDNIIHFFLKCPDVQLFWKSVVKWLRTVLDVDMSEELQESIILNDPSDIKGARIRNFITLTLKFYIYRQRLFYNNHLDVLEWAREFRMKLIVERNICMQENKHKKFKIWENLFEKLQ